MKKNIIKILISFGIVLTSLLVNTIPVNAYHSNRYVDGGGIAGLADSNYEVDWGAINFYAQSINGAYPDKWNLSSGTPYADTSVRYGHWSDQHPIGDRGWEALPALTRWGSDARDVWYVQDFGEYGGGKPGNVFNPGTAMHYSLNPDGGKWISPSGIAHNYMRWGLNFYKREKPQAYMGYNYLADNGGYYTSGSTVWSKPKTETFRAWVYDMYPVRYGNAAQADGGIYKMFLGVGGNRVNVFREYNRNSNSWSYATPFSQAEFNNSGSSPSFSMYDGGTDNMQGATVQSTGVAVNFKTEDGYDYNCYSDGANKWDRYAVNGNGFTRTSSTNGGSWIPNFELGASRNGVKYTSLKVDGAAPIWDGNLIVKNKDDYYFSEDEGLKNDKVIDKVSVKVKNLRDVRGEKNNTIGVGVKDDRDITGNYINQYLKIYKADKNWNKESKYIVFNKSDEDYDGSKINLDFVVDFNKIADLKSYYGNIVIQFVSSDKLGNTRVSGDVKLEKILPVPENGNLKVVAYDHEENSSTYWVKEESVFAIYTEGFFKSNLGIFPSETYAIFNETLTGKNIEHMSNIDYVDFSGDDNNRYLYSLDYSDEDILKKIPEEYKKIPNDRAEKVTIGDKNYLRALHIFEAVKDGDVFKLKHKTAYNYGGFDGYDKEIKYESPIQDSNKTIKVDGRAPISDSPKIEIDLKTLDVKINVNNVIDIDKLKKTGSGVNRVYAKYYEIEDDDDYIDPDLRETSIGLTRDSKNEKNWSSTINGYDLFNSPRLKVEVYAVDNVGNESMLGEKYLDLFTLSARIVPYNRQDYTGDNPILRSGQQAMLIMEVTGGPESLEIEFPWELLDLNPSLNTTINLDTNKKYLKIDHIFIPPIYTPEKEYEVYVKANRKDKFKYAEPVFTINNNVLDKVRTRLR